MGIYSIRHLFTKEPAAIAGAIRSVLFMAVLLSLVMLDEKQLAGIALGLEAVLTLFAREAQKQAVTTAVRNGHAAGARDVPLEAIADPVAPGD